MAVQAQRDMREYHLCTPILDINAVAMGWMPVPASGQIVKVTACVTTVVSADDAALSFELNGVPLEAGGVAAALVLEVATGAVGSIWTVDLDPVAGANLVLEGANGDLAATGASIEMISDNTGAGNAIICFTIRP